MTVACASEARFLECLVPLAGLWSRGYTVARDWAGLGETVEQMISGGADLEVVPLPKPMSLTPWRYSK